MSFMIHLSTCGASAVPDMEQMMAIEPTPSIGWAGATATMTNVFPSPSVCSVVVSENGRIDDPSFLSTYSVWATCAQAFHALRASSGAGVAGVDDVVAADAAAVGDAAESVSAGAGPDEQALSVTDTNSAHARADDAARFPRFDMRTPYQSSTTRGC